jgi:hypothetical protein
MQKIDVCTTLWIQPYGYVPLARTHKVVQTLIFYVQKRHFLRPSTDSYKSLYTTDSYLRELKEYAHKMYYSDLSVSSIIVPSPWPGCHSTGLTSSHPFIDIISL